MNVCMNEEEHLGGVMINKVSCYGEIMENNEGKKLLDFIVKQVLVTFEMLASAGWWARSPDCWELRPFNMIKTCKFPEFLIDCLSEYVVEIVLGVEITKWP